MKIYLVILWDRHTDEEYRVCRTLDAAKAAADELMEEYGDRYQWRPEDVEGWHYQHITELEDGPNIHIEELELTD